MIILQSSKVSRSRFLMPVLKSQWRSPSEYVRKDQLGNDTYETVFAITAKLNDGHAKWRGEFQDREDFDEFLYALASGTLKWQRELWSLCTPSWHPDINENVTYHFLTYTYITATGASNYTIPSDWNNADNVIDVIGGGASGTAFDSSNTNGRAAGSGGGGFARRTNYSTSSGTVIPYNVGIGGSRVTDSAANLSAVNGNSGGSTSFGDISGGVANAICGAFGGTYGGYGTSGSAGGGSPGTPFGNYTLGYNGGRGGNASTARSSGGGGGAAGPGGAGGNASGFTGGTGSGGGTAVATNGTQYTTSPARGAGGGGYGGGGDGGTYGGGGGANYATNGSVTSGLGTQGILVIAYTPLVWTPSKPYILSIPNSGL